MCYNIGGLFQLTDLIGIVAIYWSGLKNATLIGNLLFKVFVDYN